MNGFEDQEWLADYETVVRNMILIEFDPSTHFTDIDKYQLVNDGSDDADEIVRDFSGKNWRELSHDMITYHRSAFYFMTVHGILKFLPAYLNDLFEPDTQVVDNTWNAVIDIGVGYQGSDSSWAMTDGQVLCAILAFIRPCDFPIKTDRESSTRSDPCYFDVNPPELYYIMTGNRTPISREYVESKLRILNNILSNDEK